MLASLAWSIVIVALVALAARGIGWLVERGLVSAQESGPRFELRCAVRERLVAFIARHHPRALLRRRAGLAWAGDGAPACAVLRAR